MMLSSRPIKTLVTTPSYNNSNCCILHFFILAGDYGGRAGTCSDVDSCLGCICDPAGTGESECTINRPMHDKCKVAGSLHVRNNLANCKANQTCVDNCLRNLFEADLSPKCTEGTDLAQVSHL